MTYPFADQVGQDESVLDTQQDSTEDQSQTAAQRAAPASGPIGSILTQAQDRLNQSVAGLAGRLPGGEALAQKAEEAANTALASLARAVEEKLGGHFGKP